MAIIASEHPPMKGIRPVLLGTVIINAVVALILWVQAIPMPGWFAALLVLVSLAFVGSRGIVRHFSNQSGD